MSTMNEYTLEAWIAKFKTELNTIKSFALQTAISDGKNVTYFTRDTVLSKYSADLERYKVAVNLTQREQDFYAYNPRLFANDVYGVPEFWYLVLYANEMKSSSEFYRKRICFYTAGVTTVLDAIRDVESRYLDENAQQMTDLVTKGIAMNDDIDFEFT